MANMFMFNDVKEKFEQDFDTMFKDLRKQRDIEEVYYELGRKAILGAVPMVLTGDIIIGGTIWAIVLKKARKKAIEQLDAIELEYNDTEEDSNE